MAHKVVVLDYKTDVNKNLFRKKYTEQLKEYYLLLKQIYKNYSIECNVLWLNDFTLENII
jgi:ATP-dependent exoDNAse (exonuclease V) beta subunit